MPVKILVATPDPAFGEWLQASLVEQGRYDAHLVQTGSEVLMRAASTPYALAILDSDLPDEPFVPLARSLMALAPGLKLIVIPPENDPHHPTLAGLVPHGYLLRPFYLPGLLDSLNSLLEARNQRSENGEGAPLVVSGAGASWLEDAEQAGRELARLLLETSAQVALVAAEGGLWACAGPLGCAAAQEVAAQLSGCWASTPTDIARYLRLNATASEHFLYAVPLLDQLALALLFDPSVPLSRARAQTVRAARALAGLAAAQPLPEPAAMPPENPAGDEAEELLILPEAAGEEFLAGEGLLAQDLPAAEDESQPEVVVEAEIENAVPPASPEVELRILSIEPGDDLSQTGAEDGEEPEIDLAALLAGMPPPDPDGEPLFPEAGSEWVSEEDLPFPWEKEAIPAETSAAQAEMEARLEAVSTGEAPGQNAVECEPERVAEPAAEQTVTEIPTWLGVEEPPPARREQTQPVRAASNQDTTPLPTGAPGSSARPLPQRALPAPVEIAYTCLLIPARPDHFLATALAGQLSLWVPQLCLAFGWRLSGMVVRPDYLQWSVDLAHTVSIGNVVRVLRQRTSERIFSLYPDLRREVGRNDFWAPGYLAVRGKKPPPAALLKQFIQQTRARQGY